MSPAASKVQRVTPEARPIQKVRPKRVRLGKLYCCEEGGCSISTAEISDKQLGKLDASKESKTGSGISVSDFLAHLNGSWAKQS